MNYVNLPLTVLFFSMFLGQSLRAQDNAGENAFYEFRDIISLPATPVKDQAFTGTCWDFATISFIESELLRQGKGEFDLSEMYVVRKAYPEKARKYIMRWGKQNFYQGGQAHDVMMVLDRYGVVPEKVYTGLKNGAKEHDHRELDAVLKSFVEAVNSKKGKELSAEWPEAFSTILDTYLGTEPERFTYRAIEYTPESFAEQLEISHTDYIEITSYGIYPYYQPVELDIPDNWLNCHYYNVPLDDLLELLYYSLEKGYTVVWDGDISNNSFSSRLGIANEPEIPWNREMKSDVYEYIRTVREEVKVDQELRDRAFLIRDVVDNHLMHLIGTATDGNGTSFFKIKDSLGKDRNQHGGYIYMSEEYVKKNTIAIMVHKDAVPDTLKSRLGIE